MIGVNGSGKTTIMQAIFILRQLVLGRSFYRSLLNNIPEEVETTQIKIWLDIGGKQVIHTVDFIIETDESNNDQIVETEEKWYLKDFTGNSELVKIPLQLAENNRTIEYFFDFAKIKGLHQDNFGTLKTPQIVELFSSIAEFYKSITYYSASQFTNPSKCPISIEIPARNKRIDAEHSKWLYNLFELYDTKDSDFEDYLDIVGANGIGLVDDISFKQVDLSSEQATVKIIGAVNKRQNKQKIIIPQITIGGNVLSPPQLSEGTFKTLAMVFYLMTSKGSILLLEEPEVCIHHGLLLSIIELVKEYSTDKQIFLTTHSDYILDHLEPKNVVVVQREDADGTTAKPLNSYLKKQDLNALKHFLNEEGSLGEYWKSGGLANE